MRLINTSTLDLHEFFDADVPSDYAILSHRWDKEEANFKDYRKRRSELCDKSGYEKIRDFCAIARQLQCQWAWIDTVCIDKRSSAELSEAINSMYKYYENARICFVYLMDVNLHKCAHDFRHCRDLSNRSQNSEYCAECAAALDAFRSSSWFRRGWTLQELIAPRRMIFYDANWLPLGAKYCPSNSPCESLDWQGLPLLEELAHITGIPNAVLSHETSVFRESMAHRIGYAANRLTTRVEDMAYCLLGLLEINMPLLYGEGRRSWLRLQAELIRTSNDKTIFVWQEDGLRKTGMLADNAEAFRGVPARVLGAGSWLYDSHRPSAYAATNQGIELKLAVRSAAYLNYVEQLHGHHPTTIQFLVVPLNCVAATAAFGLQMWYLVLQRQPCGHFNRLSALTLGYPPKIHPELRFDKLCSDETIYVHVVNSGNEYHTKNLCEVKSTDDYRHLAEAMVKLCLVEHDAQGFAWTYVAW